MSAVPFSGSFAVVPGMSLYLERREEDEGVEEKSRCTDDGVECDQHRFTRSCNKETRIHENHLHNRPNLKAKLRQGDSLTLRHSASFFPSKWRNNLSRTGHCVVPSWLPASGRSQYCCSLLEGHRRDEFVSRISGGGDTPILPLFDWGKMPLSCTKFCSSSVSSLLDCPTIQFPK